MRSFVSILTSLVMALSFFHAPFLHVHEHEINEHHPHSGFFHVHVPHHRLTFSKTAEVDDLDPDDDARYQDWILIAGNSDYSVSIFLVSAVFCFTPAASSEPYVDRLILNGHDPPHFTLTSPRAPPA